MRTHNRKGAKTNHWPVNVIKLLPKSTSAVHVARCDQIGGPPSSSPRQGHVAAIHGRRNSDVYRMVTAYSGFTAVSFVFREPLYMTVTMTLIKALEQSCEKEHFSNLDSETKKSPNFSECRFLVLQLETQQSSGASTLSGQLLLSLSPLSSSFLLARDQEQLSV